MSYFVFYSVRSWFFQWYQWYTDIIQGSTNGTIGNTIGTNGAIGKDRWKPILQTIFSVDKITNDFKSYDPIWRLKL